MPSFFKMEGNMSKKIVAGILSAALLVTTMLGGCGGQDVGSADHDTAAPQESAAEGVGGNRWADTGSRLAGDAAGAVRCW